MTYSRLTTSLMTGLVLLLPVSTWAMPVSERPVLSSLRNATNTDSTTNADTADRPERSRVRQGAERAEQLVSEKYDHSSWTERV